MIQQQALNAIKRINQRLAEFEKQGLTEARTYKNLITEIKTSGLPLTQARNGNIRLSRSKFAQSTVIKKDDIIKKIDDVGSLKTEIQKARKEGYKTKREIIDYINKEGNLTEWLENNLDFVYEDSLKGYDSASELIIQMQSKKDSATRNKSYDYMWKLINEYIEEKSKLKKVTNNSSFNIPNNAVRKEFNFNGRGTV